MGYVGLRDSLKEAAAKRADEAIREALKKYPDAADMLKTMQRLRAQADFLDQVRNQVVTAPEPMVVETASKRGIRGVTTETPLESVDQQVTPIAQYPGEGDKDDAGDHGQSS
jgi:vacuolar-type H+-ATPase subunit E/Vma4